MKKNDRRRDKTLLCAYVRQNPKDVITAYKTLKNIIIDYKIDVVHGHARIPCFILNLIRKSINFRFVTTAHWVFSLKFPYKYITKWGDRSLAVSDDIKKYLIDNYGIKPGNIRVTINGIDTQKFSKILIILKLQKNLD